MVARRILLCLLAGILFGESARAQPASTASDSPASASTATAAPFKAALPQQSKAWNQLPAEEVFAPLPPDQRTLFRLAEQNSRLANEALFRCRLFVEGWLAHADPESGLIPRNLLPDNLWMETPGPDLWNGRDSAADNYPYMVLTAALTDRRLFDGRMLDMLRTEQRLTNRIDRLMDNYQFSKRDFIKPTPVLDEMIFDNAEYVKDGLIAITEWLGPSPWSRRMIGIIDDIWAHAEVETPFGKIPTRNFEVNGDLLQACSRLYWFTGDRKYLDWAMRLGDYFLLGTNHPTRDLSKLALDDHSCEVINGLSELYFAVAHAAPEKRNAYRQPLHEMFDRILQVGINEHGLMYQVVNPRTGQILDEELTDNWGYNYDGFYAVWLVDGTEAYRNAVRKALGNLRAHYTGHVWEHGSADGYADSIEGALTLLRHETIASAGEWIDSEIRTMWSKQQPDGIIEGWHGDGNFARTTLMYALWKTQGVTIQPWRPDVRIGAALDGQTLHVFVAADRKPWQGKIVFDRPRHQDFWHLPVDYPRINQFPEWFVAQPKRKYSLVNLISGEKTRSSCEPLRDGIPVEIPSQGKIFLTIQAEP